MIKLLNFMLVVLCKGFVMYEIIICFMTSICNLLH